MSSVTRICPSQAGEPPMPIVGIATASVSSRATLSAVPSMTSENAPASATAIPSRMILSRSALGVAARAVAAERVDRLRRQPDMAHHRDAATHEKRDRLGHFLAAFELDRGAAGLGQHARGGAEGLLRRFLIASRTADRP